MVLGLGRVGLKVGMRTQALPGSYTTRHSEEHRGCTLLSAFPPLISSNLNGDLGRHTAHLADEDPEEEGGQVPSPRKCLRLLPARPGLKGGWVVSASLLP